MKNLFLINEEERQRILGMHETATKKHYLSEQSTFDVNDPLKLKQMSNQNQVVVQGQGSDPYQYMKWSDKVWYAKKSEGKNPKWVEAKTQKSIDSINSKIFNIQQTVTQTKPNNVKTPETIVPKNNNKFKVKFKDKEFNTVTKDTFSDTSRDVSLKKTAEYVLKSIGEAEKLMGKISKRSYNQLLKIKNNGQLKNYSFIIVNKDAAVASMFGPNYKFIGKSSITTGAVKDVKPFNIEDKTYKNWFIRSLEFFKKNPSHRDSTKIKKWLEDTKKNSNIVKNDGSINYEDYVREKGNEKIKDFPFSYESSKQAGLNVTPGGVYSLGSGHTEKTFDAGDTTNVFPLVNQETGEKLTPAVHGAAGKTRSTDIKRFSSQDINKTKDESRSGYGCVNVDARFVKLINQYKPEYVIIIPDYAETIDIKIVTFNSWSQKIASLGEKCVKSLISLFT